MHIYIVLLIVYPQFGKQSLLAPLIMSGVVRVRSFRLRKEFRPPLRTHAGFAGTLMCSSIFTYLGLTAKYVSIWEKAAEMYCKCEILSWQNALGSKTRIIEH